MQLPPFKGAILVDEQFKNIVFEHACRMENKKCMDCLLNRQCIYACMYENIPTGWRIMNRAGRLCAPFVWQPPLDKKTDYAGGEKVVFNLNLFGSGINLLEQLAIILGRFGEEGLGPGKGSYKLHDVTLHNPFGGREQSLHSMESGENAVKQTIVTWGHIETWAAGQPPLKKMSLLFLSPTFLEEQGVYLEELYFYHIIRELTMRASTIYYFYHNMKEVELYYRDFLERAKTIKKVKDFTRFVSPEKGIKSVHQGRGLLGEATYTGGLDEFLPLLKLGQFLHMGENSIYGFGRYKMRLPIVGLVHEK